MKGIASAEKMGLKPMRLRGGQVHLAYVVYKTARHPGSVLAPVAARLHPPPHVQRPAGTMHCHALVAPASREH